MSRPKTSQGELSDSIRALRRVFFVVGAFSFAVNILLLVPALYMLQTYDRVLTSRNEGTLLALTLILIGLLALEGALEFVRSRVLARVSAQLDMQIDGRVFDAMFGQAINGKGGTARVLGDLGHVRQFLTGRGLLAFFDAPWLPLYLLVVFLLSPWLGLFAAIAAVILVALAWYNEAATGSLHALSGKLGANAGHYAGTTLRNAEVINALGMLDAMRGRWQAKQGEYLAVLGEVNDRSAMIGGAVRFFRMVLQSGILGFGAYLVLQNQLTPGGMIAASILLGRALAPVDLAIGVWRQVVSAREAFARLNGLLAAHPAARQQLTLPRPQGAIAVEGLQVAAPGRREAILKGLAFQVGAGKTIGIIGPSASGKSTLARALVGVWPPLSGAVRIDGADIAHWNRSELGPCLGYLPQDVELFDGTVAENIARFGEIVSERVVEASRRAGVHDLILHLPQGYETQIGEGGVTLSGGQRQRIALARAMYGDPVLVVLDEPNANLDEAGDAALVAAIRSLKAQRCTVFVVTHRANLLTETDAVMVMAEGRIQAFGPSADLIKGLRGRPAERPGPKVGAGDTAHEAVEGGAPAAAGRKEFA